MRQRILTLLLGLAVLVTSRLRFSLRGTTQVPNEMKTLILTVRILTGHWTRAVREQLRLNAVIIVTSEA